MEITRYSKQVVKNGINHAIDNVINRERWFADEYIKLNPQDKARRNADADLVIYGAEMIRIEIQKEMEKWFSELEKVNK